MIMLQTFVAQYDKSQQWANTLADSSAMKVRSLSTYFRATLSISVFSEMKTRVSVPQPTENDITEGICFIKSLP